MSASTGRVARNVRTANSALPSAGLLLLAAGVIPFSGWLMARNSSGYGVPFTETTGLISAGRAQLDGAAGTADGDTSIIVDTMVEDIDQSATAGDYFVDADAPAVAYGVSNHEIGKLATGRSIAGVFFGINADTGKARLWSGPAAHAMALGMLAGGTATAEAPMLRARAATTATLAATLSGIVLTADANGALAAQDGVTLAVGDRVFAKDQTAGAARGLYVVTSLGGASSKAVFTRAPEFDATAEAFGGLSVFVSEGTIAGNTTWDLTTDDPIVLGTTSLTFTKRPTLAELASTATGKGAALLGSEDAGGFTTNTTTETQVQEIFQHLKSTQGHIDFRPTDFTLLTGAPLAIFANGASAVPGLAIVDSKLLAVRWNDNATLDGIMSSFAMPPDCDITADMTVTINASKTGATLGDAVTFAVGAYNQVLGALHDADGNFGGNTGAMTGNATAKTRQAVTRTLALADLAASPANVTLTLKPTDGTLGTDDLCMHNVRISYKKKLLPS